MVARALVLVAATLWGPPAVARSRPVLGIDMATLVDEAVTLSDTPRRAIIEPVASPPVSLWTATHGLVSGGTAEEERQVAVELERAYRAVRVDDARPMRARDQAPPASSASTSRR